MKKLVVKTIFVIVIFILVGSIILNTCPSLEKWLHTITGWN